MNKLICVKSLGDVLTKGKIYDCLFIIKSGFIIEDNKSQKYFYKEKYFITLIEHREEKLNQLLND